MSPTSAPYEPHRTSPTLPPRPAHVTGITASAAHRHPDGLTTSYRCAVRLATWNLNRATWQSRRRFASGAVHAAAAWDELGSLDVDVALLQEATPPPSDLTRPPTGTRPVGVDREAWRSLPGPARWWCSAVAVWSVDLLAPSDEDRSEPLYVSQKGAYAVGVVTNNDTPVVVASVYALWDYGWLPRGTKPRYAHTPCTAQSPT